MTSTELRYSDRLGPNGTLVRCWRALWCFLQEWRLSNKYERQGLGSMTAEDLYKYTHSLLKQGRHEKAINILAVALQKKPLPADDYVILRISLMQVYMAFFRRSKSVRDFDDAKRLYAHLEITADHLEPKIRARVLHALAEFNLE